MCAFSQWTVVFFVNFEAKIPQRKCRRHGYSAYLPSFVRFQQHLRGSDVRKLQQIQVTNTTRSDRMRGTENILLCTVYPDKCWSNETSSEYSPGESFTLPLRCVKYVCNDGLYFDLYGFVSFAFSMSLCTLMQITFTLIENRCGKVIAATGHHLEGDLSKDYPDCCPKVVPNWYECILKELNKSNSPLFYSNSFVIRCLIASPLTLNRILEWEMW